MDLRVLDDERRGYALLAFDPVPDQPSLAISIRSRLQQGAYLGPRGKWQKQPHYFVARRVEQGAGPAHFRVGPEIVNHVLEFDRVEVATADGSVRAETQWENAIPDIGARSGGGTIYREAVIVAQDETTEAALIYDEPAPAVRDVKLAPEPLERAEPEVKPPAAEHRSLPTAWIAGALLALAALGGLLLALPSVRCSVLGICQGGDDGLLKTAMVCAAPKLAAEPCGAVACFDVYRDSTPAGQRGAEAQALIATAEEACEQEKAEAGKARQCADTEKARHNECSVRACVAAYLSKYPGGEGRGELERLAAYGDADCAREGEARARAEQEEARRRQDEEARKAAEEKARREQEDARMREEAARKAAEEKARREAAKDLERRRQQEEEHRIQQVEPQERIAPSFDCATDRRPAEQAICSSNELAGLDNSLHKIYGALRQKLSGAAEQALKDEQQRWLKARNACEFDEACLAELYRSRIGELQAQGGE